MRQQSVKIGTLADNVVLPKTERVVRRSSEAYNMEKQNVEAQKSYNVTEHEVSVKKTEHFPGFMIGISVVQVKQISSIDELYNILSILLD